jgi:hypothetical protein
VLCPLRRESKGSKACQSNEIQTVIEKGKVGGKTDAFLPVLDRILSPAVLSMVTLEMVRVFLLPTENTHAGELITRRLEKEPEWVTLRNLG